MSEVSGISHSNHDDHHHHKETFITKYIFSQDHKMIAKQYLILGVLFMGFIGIAMSLLFRLQLAWPEQSFAVFDIFLGDWAPEGVMDPKYIFSSCHYSRNHNGFLCTYSWFKWNFQ